MAFTNSNSLLDGRVPVVSPAGAEVVVQRASVALVTGDLTLNNFGAVGVLPAGCVPLKLFVDTDELDTGSNAIVLDVGLLNAAGTAFDTVLQTGLTVGQAGGVVQVNSSTLLRLAASTSDRKIGIKIATAPNAAAAGNIFVHTHYRSA